jgi:xanthine dehydrogenase YagR molybdenum-binding subunit
VNADTPEVTIELIEVEDKGINPLGVKGVGEIGQVGVAAAIANALFNATGRRIRELPLAAELVMDPAPV